MTPSGIEPATIRLVAQCLNQLRHRDGDRRDAIISSALKILPATFWIKAMTIVAQYADVATTIAATVFQPMMVEEHRLFWALVW